MNRNKGVNSVCNFTLKGGEDKERLAEVERKLKESKRERVELPGIFFRWKRSSLLSRAKWGSEGPSGTGLVANLELSVEPVEGGELYGQLHAGESEG